LAALVGAGDAGLNVPHLFPRDSDYTAVGVLRAAVAAAAAAAAAVDGCGAALVPIDVAAVDGPGAALGPIAGSDFLWGTDAVNVGGSDLAELDFDHTSVAAALAAAAAAAVDCDFDHDYVDQLADFVPPADLLVLAKVVEQIRAIGCAFASCSSQPPLTNGDVAVDSAAAAAAAVDAPPN